jgi:hypothetical protein
MAQAAQLTWKKHLAWSSNDPTHQELDQPISMSKLNQYITGASNKKAQGESQIPAEALKALSHDTDKPTLKSGTPSSSKYYTKKEIRTTQQTGEASASKT